MNATSLNASVDAASLNGDRRARELAELRSPEVDSVDVLVIGGGVTGAGVALDAASRGLRTVLVEKHDLGFGTSRWSSKLVHGGLRYLASGAVGIARESAVERDILLRRTAPHLVQPLPQVVPLLPGTSFAGAALVRAGFLAGDVLRVSAGTPSALLPRSRRLRPPKCSATRPPSRPPAARRPGLLGRPTGRRRTAGGRPGPHRRQTRRPGADQVRGPGGRRLRRPAAGRTDRRELPVGGPHGDQRHRGVGGELAPGLTLRPSRGTHLVLPQSAFGGLTAGLTVPVPGETNRFVFALPAPDGRVYVGLTDEAAPGPVPDVPEPADSEIEFLLSTINTALRRPLTRADLLGSFAACARCWTTAPAAQPTCPASTRCSPLTTAWSRWSAASSPPTAGWPRTPWMPPWPAPASRPAPAAPGPFPSRRRLPGDAGRRAGPLRLVRRYGTEAPAVLAEADGDPAALTPIAPGTETTLAELRFAARHEGALDVDDLLDRRTRIGLSPTDRQQALAAAESVVGG